MNDGLRTSLTCARDAKPRNSANSPSSGESESTLFIDSISIVRMSPGSYTEHTSIAGAAIASQSTGR